MKYAIVALAVLVIGAALAVVRSKAADDSKFMEWDLATGGDVILHGYIPHEGDVVEWYVRGVKCDHPDKSCEFELAIRRAGEAH